MDKKIIENFYFCFKKYKYYLYKRIISYINDRFYANEIVDDFFIYFLKYQIKYYNSDLSNYKSYLFMCYNTYIKSYYVKKILRYVKNIDFECDVENNYFVDMYKYGYIDSIINLIDCKIKNNSLKNKLKLLVQNKLETTRKSYYVNRLKNLLESNLDLEYV